MQHTNITSETWDGSNTAKGHPDLSKFKTDGIEYEDWNPNITSEMWDVSFDRKGRASWERNYFEYGNLHN